MRRMKVLYGLSYALTCLSLVCFVRPALGCDVLPAGEFVWVRLTAPVSTYSVKAGDAVHAMLTEDVWCDTEMILPLGAQIDGVVRSRHKVGWGIRHETASLELEFNRVIVSPDISFTMTARVEEVGNAREHVRNGVIEGIRSTNTFQGSINSRLIHLPTWNPYSDPVLIAYKAVFPIFPEPEIYYPAGTDLRLKTTKEIMPPAEMARVAHERALGLKDPNDRLAQLVRQLHWRVTTKKGVEADIVNLVFLGSEDEVNAAFRQAGWQTADPHTKRTWEKNLYALLDNDGYPQQPMTTLLLDQKEEDMNWQKSLNSYGRRDHLRIWRSSFDGVGDAVWVASSTHDTSAVLSIKNHGFVHHIAPDIDEERIAVIRDLNFAGCVRSVSYVARASVPTTMQNATGDVMRSDGAVAVVELQKCRSESTKVDSTAKNTAFRPGNYTFRFLRRQILTFRNDIVRANIIYGAYEAGRMTWTALHHEPPLHQEAIAMKAVPKSANDGQEREVKSSATDGHVAPQSGGEIAGQE